MYKSKSRTVERMSDFKHLLVKSHPLYLHYKFLLADIEKELSEARGILADFGCGNKPYQKLSPDVQQYIGIDIDTENKLADIYADASKTPLSSNSVDIVVAFQLLEHTPKPWLVLAEMYRVLKPNGKLFLTLPMSWELHEEPYDFFRFTEHGITALLKNTGFKNIKTKKQGTDISSTAIRLNKIIFGKPVIGKILVKLINKIAEKREKNKGKDVINYAVYAEKY